MSVTIPIYLRGDLMDLSRAELINCALVDVKRNEPEATYVRVGEYVDAYLTHWETPRAPVSEDAGAAPTLEEIEAFRAGWVIYPAGEKDNFHRYFDWLIAQARDTQAARARLSAVEAERERMREVCQRAAASSSGPGSAP